MDDFTASTINEAEFEAQLQIQREMEQEEAATQRAHEPNGPTPQFTLSGHASRISAKQPVPFVHLEHDEWLDEQAQYQDKLEQEERERKWLEVQQAERKFEAAMIAATDDVERGMAAEWEDARRVRREYDAQMVEAGLSSSNATEVSWLASQVVLTQPGVGVERSGHVAGSRPPQRVGEA